MPESILLSGSALPAPDERAGKYILFRLGHGEFGIALHKVIEVTRMPAITRVSHSPDFIAGVIALRGKFVPVVDLRLTLEFPPEKPTAETCIILVQVTLASAQQVLGLIVDAVLGARSIQASEFLQPEEFQPFSETGTRDPTPYLLGVARTDGAFKLLLDIDEVLNNLDLQPRVAA